jgi:Chlorophyll A-B binding protein
LGEDFDLFLDRLYFVVQLGSPPFDFPNFGSFVFSHCVFVLLSSRLSSLNRYIDFGWDKFDEETKLKKRAIELNNGRAAMMGILGLLVHEQLGGSLPIVGEV